MSIRSKGLVFAMEEAANTEGSTVDGISEVPAAVEQDVADVVTEAFNIGLLEAAIVETNEGAEELEEVAEVMDDSVQRGEGLDATGAAIANIGVESIYSRLGISRKAMPAMESFGGRNSRVTATRIAMEGIWDSIVSAWKAVQAAWNKYWGQLKEWFRKLLDANISVGKAAVELTKKVTALDANKKAKETVLKNSAIYKAFCDSSKCDNATVTAILSNHSETIATASSYIATAQEVISSLEPVLEKITKAGGEEGADKADHSSLTTEVTGVITSAGSKFKTALSGFAVGKSEFKGLTTVHSKQLIDGLFIRQGYAIAKDDEKDTTSVFTFEVSPDPVASSKPSGEACAVLNKTEMLALCDKVTKMSSAIDTLKVATSKVSNFEKATNKLIDKAVSKLTSMNGQAEAGAALKAPINLVKRAVNEMNSCVGKFTTEVPKLAVRAEKAALNYVSASLKAHSVTATAP